MKFQTTNKGPGAAKIRAVYADAQKAEGHYVSNAALCRAWQELKNGDVRQFFKKNQKKLAKVRNPDTLTYKSAPSYPEIYDCKS